MLRFLALIAALVIALAPPQTLSAQPLEQLTVSGLEQRIADGDFGKIRALAAEQHGEIVYRKRFDDAELGEPVDIRSAGKSLTALAVGMAIDDGMLEGVETHVWPYLGQPRGEPFDSITIKDLLGMASALDCNDWDKRSSGWEERMYRTRDWRSFALAIPARKFERDDRGEGPFSYCTAGVFLLGQVVEKATGENFDAYMQRRLFDPLGLEAPTWKRSESGEVQSGGQLTISDEALLRIGRLVLDKGVWREKRIVSEAWIDTMLTPRHRLGDHVFYGNLWWATPLRSPRGFEGAWMMKGNGGNIVAILRDYDAVLVVQAENYNRDDAERHAFTALISLLASLEAPIGE